MHESTLNTIHFDRVNEPKNKKLDYRYGIMVKVVQQQHMLLTWDYSLMEAKSPMPCRPKTHMCVCLF